MLTFAIGFRKHRYMDKSSGGKGGLSSSCWPGHSNGGIPLDDQRPIFGGEELKGSRMLADCIVKE